MVNVLTTCVQAHLFLIGQSARTLRLDARSSPCNMARGAATAVLKTISHVLVKCPFRPRGLLLLRLHLRFSTQWLQVQLHLRTLLHRAGLLSNPKKNVVTTLYANPIGFVLALMVSSSHGRNIVRLVQLTLFVRRTRAVGMWPRGARFQGKKPCGSQMADVPSTCELLTNLLLVNGVHAVM